MTIRYTVVLVIVILFIVAPGQANDGGCTAEEHGVFLPLGTRTSSIIKVVEGRTGKAGPPGPPGPGPIVNNINRDEEIETKFRGLDEKLRELEKRLERVESNTKGTYPSGCEQVHKLSAISWNGTGGVFEVYPTPTADEKLQVYCDLTTDNSAWTVFQRRMDGSVDFLRDWDEYVSGFGDNDKEFWIGLEKLHLLTKEGRYELRVDLADWSDHTAYAHYTTFSVGDSSTNYRLTVDGYNGDAGNGFAGHSGMAFSTRNVDNDIYGPGNCAAIFSGAWWHQSCHNSNLNGLYVNGGTADYGVGVVWQPWKDFKYSLKSSEMKFRKKH